MLYPHLRTPASRFCAILTLAPTHSMFVRLDVNLRYFNAFKSYTLYRLRKGLLAKCHWRCAGCGDSADCADCYCVVVLKICGLTLILLTTHQWYIHFPICRHCAQFGHAVTRPLRTYHCLDQPLIPLETTPSQRSGLVECDTARVSDTL